MTWHENEFIYIYFDFPEIIASDTRISLKYISHREIMNEILTYIHKMIYNDDSNNNPNQKLMIFIQQLLP